MTVSHNVTWFYPPPNSFLFLSTDFPPSPPTASLPPTFMLSPFFPNPLSLLDFMKYWWVLLTQLYLMQVTKAARSLWVEGHVMSTQHFTGSSPSLASLGSDLPPCCFLSCGGDDIDTPFRASVMQWSFSLNALIGHQSQHCLRHTAKRNFSGQDWK